MASSKKWNTMPLSETPPSSRSDFLAPNSSPINLVEAQPEEDEEDSTAKNRVIEDRSGQKCMNNLVNNVINMAKKNPSKFSSKELVCQQIVKDMKRKRSFNFVIEDLRCEFRKVADLFGCPVTEVQNEISCILDKQERKKGEHESKVSYQWEDYNFTIRFPRKAVLDDLVYKEVNQADRLWNDKEIFIKRKSVIDRILQNLANDGFSIDDLEDYHFQKVAKFYQCEASKVEDEFLRQNDGVEKEYEKLDALITEEIRIVKEGKGKIKANTLTRHQCVVRIWTKVKRAEISVPLKPQHFEAVAKFFNCPVSEVESDYFKLFQPPTPHPNHKFALDQDNYQEGPVAKKPKLDPESKF
ncbi:hypothetical protein CAEBREN_00848 [Caenorhabditis brenneri]|uniref:SPK domain-containing protein n=1 Tax=Caenorhabditis brenneri TaxID=135651 RepID=G0NE09_CAEBE|nr:hypothetical protein CAEBREN_00848 [Caenorhabditis brenneri]